MGSMSLKNWATVIGSAFAGGGFGYLSQHASDGIPQSAAQWKAFGIGFALAGAVAVWHLFMPKPGAAPQLPPPAGGAS